MPSFRLSPDGLADFPLDWSRDLLSGETISASEWTVPDGLTEGTTSIGSDTTTIWLSGGTVGTIYPVRNVITTSAGRQFEQTIHIQCERI